MSRFSIAAIELHRRVIGDVLEVIPNGGPIPRHDITTLILHGGDDSSLWLSTTSRKMGF